MSHDYVLRTFLLGCGLLQIGALFEKTEFIEKKLAGVEARGTGFGY
jgi:hypothetical protein